MLKKFIAVAVLFHVASAHAACSINFDTASNAVEKVLDAKGWGFKNYDEICRRLNQEKAALLISGQATVLGEQSIGWAGVMLKDAKLPIFTNSYGGVSTTVNSFASMNKAEELLYESINNAVENVKWDRAFEALNAARQSSRAALRK